MSVNVGQRAKSPLEAQVKADELVTYTIKILSNERTFNPKYQALADRVIDTAVDALVCIDEANDIMVGDDPALWDERRSLQRLGCRALRKFCTLLRICRGTYHLRKRRYVYWASLAYDALDIARRWRDSDANRYRHLSSRSAG